MVNIFEVSLALTELNSSWTGYVNDERQIWFGWLDLSFIIIHGWLWQLFQNNTISLWHHRWGWGLDLVVLSTLQRTQNWYKVAHQIPSRFQFYFGSIFMGDCSTELSCLVLASKQQKGHSSSKKSALLSSLQNGKSKKLLIHAHTLAILMDKTTCLCFMPDRTGRHNT